MGKPSPPPAPDYVGAAQAQGAANVDAARTGAKLSNPNIIGPLGSQTVQYGLDGDQDIPTITQTLTPAAQATLDAQQEVQLGLAGLGKQALGTAGDVLGSQFTPSNVNIQTGLGQQGSIAPAPDLESYGTARSGIDGGPIQGGISAGMYGQAQGISGYGQAQGGLQAGPSAQGGVQGPNLQGQLDTADVARMPVNAGMTAQNAIMSRLAPQIQQQNDALTQQLANQGITQGSEAYNRALTQQGQTNNDLLTQAALQGIGVDMSANAQGMANALNTGNFANTAELNKFGAGMQNAGLYNAALGQNFQQAGQAQQLNNAAQQQNYAQQLGAQQLGNQAVGQNFAQGVAAQESNNAAQAQGFSQNAQNLGLYNQALGQNQNTALQQQQAALAAQNQGFNQSLQGAQFGNQAAAQNLAQQLALYNQPLNQISALMSGSQIQMPQFQGYTGQNVQAAPIANATAQQGQWAQNNYANQMAGYNSTMQGIGGLFGAALPLAFSDIRLKSNIVRVGTHPLGIGVYEYDIFGERQRGVMAHEVEAVRPGAVMDHPSGFKMVNYGALDA